MRKAIKVFSKKLGKRISIDPEPSGSDVHDSQKTGLAMRMLVAPERFEPLESL